MVHSKDSTKQNSPTRDFRDSTPIGRLKGDIKGREHLQGLSDLELIHAVLGGRIADDLRVLELMDRLYPAWHDELPPPAPPPEQPKYVSAAVPFDVAVEFAAYSECHCEADSVLDDPASSSPLRPCLFCAVQAALYRATKLEMYKPEKDGAE